MAQGPPYYLTPDRKWHPIYTPPSDWQVVSPTTGLAPIPPEGALIHWWMLPKDQWPVAAPWGQKLFGQWPASKVSTGNDLVGHPPFGYLKIKMAGQEGAAKLAFMHLKMQVRPNIPNFPLMIRYTPDGQDYWIIETWDEVLNVAKFSVVTAWRTFLEAIKPMERAISPVARIVRPEKRATSPEPTTKPTVRPIRGAPQ